MILRHAVQHASFLLHKLETTFKQCKIIFLKLSIKNAGFEKHSNKLRIFHSVNNAESREQSIQKFNPYDIFPFSIEYILKQWLNSEPPGCVHYRLYSFVKGYSVSYALIFNCVNTWPLRTHQSTIIFGHVPYLIENIAGGTFQKAI